MTSTHPSGKSSQMPEQLVIKTYHSDDCERNMERKVMENSGPGSTNSANLTHYTPNTQRVSSTWRLDFRNVLLVVVCLMLVGLMAQQDMLLKRVQALENRECGCTHHEVPTQDEADWPMASTSHDHLVQQEPLLYQPQERSRVRRSSPNKVLPKDIREALGTIVDLGMKCPVESFVGNFNRHWYWQNKDDVNKPENMKDMHCKPNLTANARVDFPEKGCRLSFFERSSLLSGTREKNLLEFSEETGIFKVQRSGVYLLQVNITIVDATRQNEAGLYVGDNPIMVCQHGGFRCPASTSDQRIIDRICTMNGVYHLLRGDELSLQTMADKMAYRLEEYNKRKAVFTAVLLSWTDPF